MEIRIRIIFSLKRFSDFDFDTFFPVVYIRHLHKYLRGGLNGRLLCNSGHLPADDDDVENCNFPPEDGQQNFLQCSVN